MDATMMITDDISNMIDLFVDNLSDEGEDKVQKDINFFKRVEEGLEDNRLNPLITASYLNYKYEKYGLNIPKEIDNKEDLIDHIEETIDKCIDKLIIAIVAIIVNKLAEKLLEFTLETVEPFLEPAFEKVVETITEWFSSKG